MSTNLSPVGLVTIDVEPDNVWENTQSDALENIQSLQIFHSLCLEHSIKPTYLLSWSVVSDKQSCQIIEHLMSQGECEIGIHPHLWEIPPILPDDTGTQAWVSSHYSDDVLEEKLSNLIELIRSRLVVPLSHRSGRWGMESRQVDMLLKHGINIDTSVTPGIDWSLTGAPDYSESLLHAYYVDPTNFLKSGSSKMLEIPCTTRPGIRICGMENNRYLKSVLRRLKLDVKWLRPSFDSKEKELINTGQWWLKKSSYLNLCSHSSEFKAGCSPHWPTQASIDNHFKQLHAVFEWWNNNEIIPKTLKEYRNHISDKII